MYNNLYCVSWKGSGLTASSVLHGMVFKRETEGDITSIKDAKIAVFSCPFDCMVTETKVKMQLKMLHYHCSENKNDDIPL